MRGDDFQPGVFVERAFKNEVLQRDRRVERIADGVGEPAVALESARKLRRALRMDEQRRAEFLSLGPYRGKFRFGKILAEHASADSRALQPLLLDGGFELLHREIGELQAERGKRREAIRVRGAELGELLVVDLDDLGGEITVLAVPGRIDR